MPNSYFQFKKFKIEQSNCANKVSTDACVFGGVLAQFINKKHNVLDIGCGSGLLCLMLAQKGANIVGVEIEKDCSTQALENILSSPYQNQIEVINNDIKKFQSNQQFDYIISNPPFFNNTYKNPSKTKNIARQTETLSAIDWSKIITNLANTTTTIALLLSNNDVFNDYQSVLRENNYHHQKVIKLYDKEDANCKRVILLASQNNNLPISINNITYKNFNSTYTDKFIQLLKPYYLYL